MGLGSRTGSDAAKDICDTNKYHGGTVRMCDYVFDNGSGSCGPSFKSNSAPSGAPWSTKNPITTHHDINPVLRRFRQNFAHNYGLWNKILYSQLTTRNLKETMDMSPVLRRMRLCLGMRRSWAPSKSFSLSIK